MIKDELELRDDEVALLKTYSKRCKECGHLGILHNNHCCDYCKVPGCRCMWGYVDDKDGPSEKQGYELADLKEE